MVLRPCLYTTDVTTMAVSFGNIPLRPNQSKYCDWTKSKPNPPHQNLLVLAILLSGDVQQPQAPLSSHVWIAKNQLPYAI